MKNILLAGLMLLLATVASAQTPVMKLIKKQANKKGVVHQVITPEQFDIQTGNEGKSIWDDVDGVEIIKKGDDMAPAKLVALQRAAMEVLKEDRYNSLMEFSSDDGGSFGVYTYELNDGVCKEVVLTAIGEEKLFLLSIHGKINFANIMALVQSCNVH